jgi:hypothetical protein
MNLRNEIIAELNYEFYLACELRKTDAFLPFISLMKTIHRTEGEEWTKDFLMGTLATK